MLENSPRYILEYAVGKSDGVGHHSRPRRRQHDVRRQHQQEEAVPLAEEVEAAPAAGGQFSTKSMALPSDDHTIRKKPQKQIIV